MPIYLFQSDDGSTHEELFAVDEAPRIGDEIVRDGTIYRRVVSFSLDTGKMGRDKQYPYVSRGLMRRISGAKHDAKGRPIVESKQHERELAARHDLVKDGF